jgi:hypothetical protein
MRILPRQMRLLTPSPFAEQEGMAALALWKVLPVAGNLFFGYKGLQLSLVEVLLVAGGKGVHGTC